MDSLPHEILLIIGLEDIQTYHGMISIPKFARLITCGIRLTAMEKFEINIRFHCGNIITWNTLDWNSSLGRIPAVNGARIKIWKTEYIGYGHGGIEFGMGNYEIAYGRNSSISECTNSIKLSIANFNDIVVHNSGYRKLPHAMISHSGSYAPT